MIGMLRTRSHRDIRSSICRVIHMEEVGWEDDYFSDGAEPSDDAADYFGARRSSSGAAQQQAAAGPAAA